MTGYPGMANDELTLETIKTFAASRGGECLSGEVLGRGTKHRWRCAEGHEFEASPRLLIDAGYWCPECFPSFANPSPWDWDARAQRDPLLNRFQTKS